MIIIPPVAPSSFTPSSFNPSFLPKQSPKTVWQHTVAQADLPFHTKGILLIVATEWMDADGGSCFPTEEQIMAKAGVSRPCLTRHMRIAVEGGFIERWRWGYGNGNRRYNYRAIIPGAPASTVEMGNEVSYPTGEMGNEVAQHKPSPIDNQFQKPESAATPEPYRPEPAPQAQAPLPQSSLRTAKTEAPDSLPDAWLEQAGLLRSDLTADQIKASADVFLDHNRAKGILLVDWLPAWRNWIRREKASKAPQNAQQAPQPANRYSSHDVKEKPVSAAVRAALEAGEQRRIDLLIQNGIDPITGFKSAPPAATALPDGDPLPPGRNESPEDYDRRFEQHRQFQLRRLQELIDARAKGSI